MRAILPILSVLVLASIAQISIVGNLQVESFNPTSIANSPFGCGGACPQGVVDYGLNQGVPYSYSTNAFVAWANFTRLGIGFSTVKSTNHEMSIQLNLVDGNVSENGNFGEYWIQNVFTIKHLSTGGFQIGIADNIWNFSYPNAVMKSPIAGNQLGDCSLVSYGNPYVCETSVSIKTTLSFEIQLKTVTGLCGNGASSIQTSFSVYHSNKLLKSEAYDQVCFTSPASVFPAFTIGGLTPSGNYKDAEFVLCGAAGTVTITKLSMKMSLSHSANNVIGIWASVSHAYSSGGDSGESVSGVKMSASGETGIGAHGSDNSIQLW